MVERPVALIVHQAGACSLLKVGDRMVLSGAECVAGEGSRLCAQAIASTYPKLRDLLTALPPNAGLPDDYLLCDGVGCEVAFRMEFTAVPVTGSTKVSGRTTMVASPNATRRLEKGAQAATTVLKKSIPFLSRLPKDVAAELVSACTTNRYETGEIILMQGVVGERLYIVAEGNVEVARYGKDNDETVLVTLGIGDCFGEMSVLTGELTSAEVRARGTAAVLSVHRDKLEGLLLKRPLLSREFSKLLADRLKATNVSLESELNRGILGKLSMISLVDLVQTLHQSRRTGTLVLNFGGSQGRLGFRNGLMKSAVLGETQGEEAFYKLVCWPEGDFCFETNEPDEIGPGQITTDTMFLMMEGMRRMDESRAQTPA